METHPASGRAIKKLGAVKKEVLVLDKKLLEILACPRCKKEIIEEQQRLVCRNCRKTYPIKENIPVMLIEEAADISAPQETKES
jgi:uncharacterized protein YbaR (Trm112 family)